MSHSGVSRRDTKWFEQVLRMKYNDPLKLIDSLDRMFGTGNYILKTRSNRWILFLHNPLQQAELEEIEQQMRVHWRQ